MIEQLTIIPIRITKAGQQYSFQQKLPRCAQKIIGIETGVTMRSPLPAIAGNAARVFKRSVFLGSLRLQGTGSSNLFYAADIMAGDNSIADGEFPKGPAPVKGPGSPFHDFHICTHGTKREEDPLDIPGCGIIGGIYRDSAGLVFVNPVHYHINIYVWTSNRQA